MKILKYACAVFLALSFANAAQIGFASEVKNVSLSDDLSAVAGKLLPTNEIEILEKKDGKIKFAIKGYQNPSAPNIIYFTPKARIIALSFAKNKAPEFEILEKKDGFNIVRAVAYSDDKNIVDDVNKLFESAKTAYNENCGLCHALHNPSDYEANRLPALFNGMVGRTGIPKNQHWSVIQYLQKHSKDVNIK